MKKQGRSVMMCAGTFAVAGILLLAGDHRVRAQESDADSAKEETNPLLFSPF